MSSSVDDFMSDDKKNIYYWDHYDGMIKRTAEKEKDGREHVVDMMKQLESSLELYKKRIKEMKNIIKTDRCDWQKIMEEIREIK